MDSDSTTRRGALNSMMEQFARGRADVLVGTQMVTKGHDLPGVTLVGVLLADLSMHLPDFRAQERTFQLLVQVAGRAGRGEIPGKVIIQTFLPGHECITLAKEQRYQDFFELEHSRRTRLGYPPARRLMLVRVSSPDPDSGSKLAQEVSRAVRRGAQTLDVLGPAVSPLAKLRGRYRWQMLVKSTGVTDLRRAWLAVQQRVKVPKDAKILFDVDPYAML
jgi:primosomal protein N' (replication factor Y)